MTETLDDARLRATEAQMRHALGLDGQTAAPGTPEHPAAPPPAQADRLSLHRPPRRFVRDGEVPVTVVRRTHPTDAAAAAAGFAPAAQNQLEAARQTIRSQAMATERAERALNDAQATIRDLRTKLQHERMARDEALQAMRRVEAERDEALSTLQTMRTDLATERVGRERLEQELRRVLEARRAADQRLASTPRRRGRPPKVVVEGAEPPVPRKRGRPRKVVVEGAEPPLPRKRGRPRKVPVPAQSELGLATEQAPRRRGRPPKQREPEPVKWWLKGWKASAD